MEKKPSLTVLLGLGKKPKSDEMEDPEMDMEDSEEEYEEEDPEMLQMAADEVMSAFKSGDSKALAEALQLFVAQCK